MNIKNRSVLFDIMKLIAMLMVVVDHSSVRWIEGIQYTQAYNYIFITQMPVFMFVSGYFIYHNIYNNYTFLNLIRRIIKTIIIFIIPFISFCFIVTIIKQDFVNIGDTIISAFKNPSQSLWFLWALMWMEIFTYISLFVVSIIIKDKIFKKTILTTILYTFFLLIPLFIWKKTNLFDCKLIVYYSIYFILGFIFYFFWNYYVKRLKYRINWFILLFLPIIVIAMILRPTMFFDDESVINMSIRIIASCSSIFLLFILAFNIEKFFIIKKFSFFGKYSLELYYTHFALLAFPFLTEYISFDNPFLKYSMYFVYVICFLLICIIIIAFTRQFKITSFVLYGKYDKKDSLFLKCIKKIIRDKMPFFSQLIYEFKIKSMFYLKNGASLNEKQNKISKQYKKHFGVKVNFDNPQRYTEKIQVRKLHDNNPLISKLCDRFLVREWVSEKIGSTYLIPLFGVYDSFDKIDFSQLPNQFVLKTNSPYSNTIIWNNEKNNIRLLKRKITFELDFFPNYCEYDVTYSKVNPIIIAEKYIDGLQEASYYKFMCFNGIIRYIIVDNEYNHNHKRTVFDINWNKQKWQQGCYESEENLVEPDNMNEMIMIVEKLCESFDHVIISLCNINGKIYFYEMIFTNACGFERLYPDIMDFELGNLWNQNIVK